MSLYQLVVSPHVDSRRWTQVRFPRSKKKRIRKKWRKDSSNWRMVTESTVYVIAGNPPMIVGSQATIERLREI